MAEMGVEHGDGMAPNYELRVEGLSLSAGVTQFIERVEYESADGVVDMMKVSVMNPDFYMSELKLFLPGNEMALWFGYGPDLTFVGRAVIFKVRSTFPPDGMPGMSITAYTKDRQMAERRPDPDGTAKEKAQKKAVWNGFEVSEVVRSMAYSYGFQLDIDDAPELKGNFYQPTEMSDFDFIRGLSNEVGYFFWVDGDEDGKWWLHFKSPAKVGPAVQEKVYTFKYNSGDDTTLTTFEPEMLLADQYTKVVAELMTPSGLVLRKSFTEERDADASPRPETEKAASSVYFAARPAASIKFFIKDFSIALPVVEGIGTEAELERYVDLWIKKHRQEFATGKGRVVGLESLRARQSHKIKNVGAMYDGSWFFSRVRHIFDSEGGYDCEFDVRREIL